MTNQHDSKPARRFTDPPHDLIWWGQRAAATTAILTLLAVGIAFAYNQVATPLERKIDLTAAKDSIRAEMEKNARIAGDSEVSHKLDIVIQLLSARRHY